MSILRRLSGRCRRIGARAIVVVALLVLAAPIVAQEQQGEGSGEADDADRARQLLEPKDPEGSARPFFYLFPTAVQTGFDSTGGGDDSFSDMVTVFVPAVASLSLADERARFYMIYEPQFEHFAERQDLNSWNHSAAMVFDYRISPRLSFGAGGSFLKTADPTRAIASLPLVLDRGDFVSARGFISLGYRLSRQTSVDLTVDRGLVRYDALSGKPDVGIDSVGTGVIVGLSHQLSAVHTVGVRYAYVDAHSLEDAADLPTDLAALLPLVPQHGVDAGWTYDAARDLTISLSAGVAYGNRLTWLASASVEKKWRYVRLEAGYQRLLGSYDNFAPRRSSTGQLDVNQPLLPTSSIGTAADIFSASVEGVTGRVQVASRLQLALSSFADQGPYLDGLTAGLGVRYELTDRLQPFVQAEYTTQGLSPEVGLRRSRGRYLAGLVLVLGPGPRDTSLREELERRRNLLPYAGAKRPW